MPLDGWHAAAVPGAPHAYATLNREFGTLPLADLLAPALAYAEAGIVVSEDMSRTIAGAAGKLGQFADSAALYFPDGTGTTPRRPLGAARSGADHPGLCHRWSRGVLSRRGRGGDRAGVLRPAAASLGRRSLPSRRPTYTSRCIPAIAAWTCMRRRRRRRGCWCSNGSTSSPVMIYARSALARPTRCICWWRPRSWPLRTATATAATRGSSPIRWTTCSPRSSRRSGGRPSVRTARMTLRRRAHPAGARRRHELLCRCGRAGQCHLVHP